MVEPNKLARRIEIEDKLVTLQKLVGGYIEEYMPFEDDIALIINGMLFLIGRQPQDILVGKPPQGIPLLRLVFVF